MTTNNLVEVWHLRFDSVVGRHHLGTYQLIHEIRKEQHRVQHIINRIEGGLTVKRRVTVAPAQREARIRNILSRSPSSTAELLRRLVTQSASDWVDEDSDEDSEECEDSEEDDNSEEESEDTEISQDQDFD